MGKKLFCLILLAALLAGCTARGEVLSPPEQPQLPEQSAAHFTPEPDMPQAPILEDNPDSPYPMAVESWQVDMDGDSIDELVELRAEQGYFGNEIEPETWFEGDASLYLGGHTREAGLGTALGPGGQPRAASSPHILGSGANRAPLGPGPIRQAHPGPVV